MSAITGPIAPYSNVPINTTFYKPQRYFIEDIEQGVTTIVTATTDMDYVIGQEIRLIIPEGFGCRGLNGQTGIVIDIPADDQVEVTINSVYEDAFTPVSGGTQPQIVAIGDYNSGEINANGRVNNATNIPGSFINIG